jgi:L-threonylcarbamoyladenylate synthase
MISTDIALAAAALRNNQIIGLPTETVYGLAGNIYSEAAILEIYRIKQRPLYNPLIVHIKHADELQKIAKEIPEAAYVLAKAFWPGALTLLLKKQASIPDVVTAGKDTVAVRMPNHPMALALLQSIDFPVAAPSANPFGKISPTKAQHVEDYFGDTIGLVLDGGICCTGVESTIVGFDGNKTIVYRLGGVRLEDIQHILPSVTVMNTNNENPQAPGMLSKHYSPTTPLVFTNDVAVQLRLYASKKIGLLLFDKEIRDEGNLYTQKVLSPKSNLQEAAANLYEALHAFDKLDLDIIIAEQFPEQGFGMVINDKLRRASAK